MANTNKAKKLSSIFSFNPADVDFIDIDLADDLELFVDPLLFWRSPHPEYHAVHAIIIKFFNDALDLVREGKISQAKKMFKFPEPENLLGVSAKGHKGRGMDLELGGKLFNAILGNKDILENGMCFINELQLVIENVGPDLISDMTVNIAKDFFVKYTQEQCELYNIPLHKVTTWMFHEDELDWDDSFVLLPILPDSKEPFLLTPLDVVRRRLVTLNYKEAYQDYLRHVFKERLRDQFAGLAKPPKLTWKEVGKYYPNRKSVVVEEFAKNPNFRRDIVASIERNTQQRGIELTKEKYGDDFKISTGALKDIFKSLGTETKLKEDIGKVVDTRVQSNSTDTLLLIDDLNEILTRASNELVVVLGSYDPEQADPFDEVSNILKNDSYEVCIIKDMPDINSVNPRQKLFTYAAAARFLIVLDYGPSGHLSEIELLKDLGKPVGIISKDQKGSSYMTAGIEFSNTYYNRFTEENHGDLKQCTESSIKWAEAQISEAKKFNEESLPWLNKVE